MDVEELSRNRSLRLGIIGLSSGNGHPYSWSAIFNGYDPVAMATCPFPAIPSYLAKQHFPADAIAGAKVTHVWTQDPSVTEHISKASLVPNMVRNLEQMLEEVDAVLLARDDAENHLKYSEKFLAAGLPIYIDKPIALKRADLFRLLDRQQYPGQIFSCSALRYAEEFNLTASDRAQLGPVRHIQAITPKSWSKYGVHLIDPVLAMFDLYRTDCSVWRTSSGLPETITVNWEGLTASFLCTGELPADIRIRLFGELGNAERVFSDSFTAFKSALERFVRSIRLSTEETTASELEAMVSILERGAIEG